MGFIPVIAAAVSAIAGTVSTVQGFRKSAEKPPAPQALPEAPKVAQAQETAAQQVEKRRRISLLSGGNTDVTRGQAVLQPGDVGKKGLLGA